MTALSMTESLPSPEPVPFAPVAGDQRIEALDVVRGFALLGIFLMNIEWFNRPFAAFNEGIPRDATGLDRAASWFIAYFVQGKFWTIFSMLFGMGFAVMLVRAERAGRPFTTVYLRRILALAVFGALHFIFVWGGDILFSYAVGALALLIVLYATAKPVVIACLILMGLGAITGTDGFFGIAGGLAVVGLLALYLRSEKRLAFRGRSIPIFSFVLLLAGTVMSLVAVVFWLLPDGPVEPRIPLSVFGPLVLVTGWLSWKYGEPAGKRSVRMAVAIYVFFSVGMTAIGVAQHIAPDPAAPVAASPARPADAAGVGANQPRKKRDERAAEIRTERARHLEEQATEKRDELRTFTTGSYADTVAWRAREFPGKAANDAGFAVLLVGMFLLGVWFVRSGVMEEPAKHLAFFRKLAIYGLPVGIGLGIATCFIAVSHTPGDRNDGWLVTRGLVMLGNLPACLGYVGLVVTMLHSRSFLSRIRVLAPLGRMALTNYLMQSVICMTVFYGFGLGLWGLPRAQQVLFVAVVYALQIASSHWWLARFRYGPMEWLWRGFTYRQIPPLRIAALASQAQAA